MVEDVRCNENMKEKIVLKATTVRSPSSFSQTWMMEDYAFKESIRIMFEELCGNTKSPQYEVLPRTFECVHSHHSQQVKSGELFDTDLHVYLYNPIPLFDDNHFSVGKLNCTIWIPENYYEFEIHRELKFQGRVIIEIRRFSEIADPAIVLQRMNQFAKAIWEQWKGVKDGKSPEISAFILFFNGADPLTVQKKITRIVNNKKEEYAYLNFAKLFVVFADMKVAERYFHDQALETQNEANKLNLMYIKMKEKFMKVKGKYFDLLKMYAKRTEEYENFLAEKNLTVEFQSYKLRKKVKNKVIISGKEELKA